MKLPRLDDVALFFLIIGLIIMFTPRPGQRWLAILSILPISIGLLLVIVGIIRRGP